MLEYSRKSEVIRLKISHNLHCEVAGESISKNSSKTIPWNVLSSLNVAFLSKDICQLLANFWDERFLRSPLKNHDMDTLSCVINTRINKLLFF